MRRIRNSFVVVGMLWLLATAFANPTYFVEADMVRAEGAVVRGPVCVPNSVFFPGEKIVSRAPVIGTATGAELAFEDVQARGLKALVKLEGHDDVAKFFSPAGGPDMPPGPSFFRGPWEIPADAPAGAYAWHIEVVDAQGNTATVRGLAAGTSVELAWMSADPAWNVGDGTFDGTPATETRTVVATATTAADGTASLSFAVPEDYGYVHNLFVEAGGERLARQGFTLVPTLSISPASGPVGTPITITMTEIGYRFRESVWHMIYGGAHIGWMSAITSNGTAVVTLPASGAVGVHTL